MALSAADGKSETGAPVLQIMVPIRRLFKLIEDTGLQLCLAVMATSTAEKIWPQPPQHGQGTYPAQP